MKQRLSSLRALIFMTHGNFDTEKVSVTFSCVRIFYFSRKLQSGNDLINACLLGCSLKACQFGAALPVSPAHGCTTQREIEGEMQTTHPHSEQGLSLSRSLSQSLPLYFNIPLFYGPFSFIVFISSTFQNYQPCRLFLTVASFIWYLS